MGTHKFKLSNIISNVWFHKLKSTKTNKTTTIPDQASNEDEAAAAISVPASTTPLPVTISHSRKSYHIKSSKKRRPTAKSSAACSCATSAVHSVRSKSTSTTSSSSIENLSLPPEARFFDRMIALSSTSCNCSSNSLLPDSDDDVLNGIDRLSLAPSTEDTAISRIELPPIKTEHKKFSDLVSEIGPRKQRKRISASSGSPRVRIRANSPRLSKRVGSHGRRRRSPESVAMVKTSADPERDFRESMVEMIVENEIRAVKDLEELLACYLSLNSVEYHHVIVEVFKQIWFDLNGIH